MGIHTRVIKLDVRYTSLEELYETILINTNNRRVTGLSEIEIRDIEESEITLYSNWEDRDGIETGIQEINFHENTEAIGEANVRFLVKTAYIEYAKHKKRDRNDVLLAKENRTNSIKIDVVFFENENKVYAIICTIPNHENKVLNLIKPENISQENADYKINANEFLWLFYRYSTDCRMLDDNLRISNITSFTGNIFNEEHVIQGNSDVASTLIVTKAFVSCGHPFTKMKVGMDINGYGLVFLVDEHSNLNIDADSVFLTQQDTLITLPLYIVAIVIPLIHQLYSDDDFEDNSLVQEEFSKRIGKDVINEIMRHNNILISDL